MEKQKSVEPSLLLVPRQEAFALPEIVERSNTKSTPI